MFEKEALFVENGLLLDEGEDLGWEGGKSLVVVLAFEGDVGKCGFDEVNEGSQHWQIMNGKFILSGHCYKDKCVLVD